MGASWSCRGIHGLQGGKQRVGHLGSKEDKQQAGQGCGAVVSKDDNERAGQAGSKEDKHRAAQAAGAVVFEEDKQQGMALTFPQLNCMLLVETNGSPIAIVQFYSLVWK